MEDGGQSAKTLGPGSGVRVLVFLLKATESLGEAVFSILPRMVHDWHHPWCAAEQFTHHMVDALRLNIFRELIEKIPTEFQ